MTDTRHRRSEVAIGHPLSERKRARQASSPQARRRATSPLFAIQFTLLFGLVLPAVLSNHVAHTATTLEGGAALALAVYSSWRVGVLLSRTQPRYVGICFFVFVYIWFGLAGFVQLDADRFLFPEDYLGRTFSTSTRTTSLAIIWLGVLAFEVGTLWTTRRPAATTSRRSHRVLSVRRLEVLSLAAILTSLVIVVVIDPRLLLTSRDEIGVELGRRGVGGFVGVAKNIGLRIPPLVAAYATLVLLFQEGGRPWRRTPIPQRVVAVAVVVVALVVNNPVTTPRSVVGAMLLSFAFAVLRPHRIRARQLTFLAIILALLVAYPAANEFRRADPSVVEQPTGVRDSLLEAADFAMYGQVHIGEEYVDQEGIRGGRQVSSAVLFFVPRSIWPGKAFDTGDVMHDALGYPEELNPSSPLWAELYVDGAWFGVVVGFFALGALTARWERIGNRDGPFSLTGLMVPMFAAYSLYFLRGSLLAFVGRFAVVVLLMVLLTTARRRPADD